MKRTSNTYVTQFSQSDPQLIFQKLTAAGSVTLNTTAELLQYEHAIFSSSKFESFGLLEQAAKATLGETILIIGHCHSHELPLNKSVEWFQWGISTASNTMVQRPDVFTDLLKICISRPKALLK